MENENIIEHYYDLQDLWDDIILEYQTTKKLPKKIFGIVKIDY